MRISFAEGCRTWFALLLLGAALLLGTGRPLRADDGIFPPAPAARAAIDFDGRGFLLHGRRTPLISAGLEYARVPHALWRDRLQRLQRAGFNCVEIYTFWNWHEPQEGKFDFSGDHDLDAFLKLVHQMGLYAIVRVGPYFCAEWDSGGYPVWLRFKPGVLVREDNPQFEAAVDHFWDKLLPIVAANQIHRGGAVVLVQLENEHPLGWGKEMPNGYFTHLRDKALSLGLEVPYFFSGLHHGSDPAGDRSWDSVGRKNPWFSTEFWSVWYDHYGPRPEDADTYERRTWKIWAYGGGGYNYYMAYGGTNFGYTNNNEDAASYDYGAAVGQAGDLRPLFYRFKRIAWFARSFPEILENSVNADATFQGVATSPAVRVTARRSPSGSLVFLDNPGKTAVQTQIKDTDGRLCPAAGPMTLAPGEILPVVKDAPLTAHITLALGAASILGTVPEGRATTLVVYGLPGSGGELQFAAPAGARPEGAAGAWIKTPAGRYVLSPSYPADRPAEYRLIAGTESVRVLSMSSALADHTWFVAAGGQTHIVCGPAYVGDAAIADRRLRLTTECGLSTPGSFPPTPYTSSSSVLIYGPEGGTAAPVGPAAGPAPLAAPVLSPWSAQPVAEAAPEFADARWLASPEPLPMGADGDAGAYAWYRATLNAPSAGEYTLTFKGAGDRLVPFLDGIRVPDTRLHHGVVDLRLTSGAHSVAILASHGGRDKLFNHLGSIALVDAKGLVGPARLRVTDGAGVPLTQWRLRMAEGQNPAVPPASDAPGWAGVTLGDDVFHGRQGFVWYQTTLSAGLLSAGTPVARLLHFDGVDDNGTVFLDGRQIARHEGWSEAFDVPLGGAAPMRPVTLSVLVENTDGAGGLGPVSVVSVRYDALVSGWKMRGGIKAGLSAAAWKPLPVEASQSSSPHYYRAQFTATPPGASGFHPILRLVTGGLSAGFAWLNGHNLGRYPEKVAINGLYLPECWLRAGENTLVLFDEEGKRPDAVTLAVEAAASRNVVKIVAQPLSGSKPE